MMSTLPALPFWLARSFWATVLTALLTICNATGIDLLARLGTDEAGLLHALDLLLPLATGLWAWLERRAPTHRLALTRR